jgi:HTH-type transcriptional regulator/antitoxin HigA
METKPIRNDQDYETSLAEIERIFDAIPGTEDGDRLDVLVTLVEAYETKLYSIPLPDPIEAIYYHLERLGITRKELEPLIGSRARVSEILNKKRPLSLRMIRNLHAGLGISTDVLFQEYPLKIQSDSAYSPKSDRSLVPSFLKEPREEYLPPGKGAPKNR